MQCSAKRCSRVVVSVERWVCECDDERNIETYYYLQHIILNVNQNVPKNQYRIKKKIFFSETYPNNLSDE